MSIFKTYTFTWWQAGIFKLSLLSLGVAIGAYWPEVFAPYVLWLVALGVVLGLYIAYLSLSSR